MFFFIQAALSAKFAVLFAGSNEFYNYRHQADIMTIYQQLLNHGFTADNIIQFAYDDIADSSENPYKGKIFHTTDHTVNVYDASTITYSKKKVTAQQFYDTLTSLPTTSNDYVFIYYDNHGGSDILGVPDGCGDYITGEGLDATFKTMNDKGLYKYILFGVEACYAGSVAELIKSAPNMAIITASNNHESSYAAVYDDDIGTYLTNEFTNNWLADVDANPDEAVGDLYDHTKQQTQESHVSYYGDDAVKQQPIKNFLGTPQKITVRKSQTVKSIAVPQMTATSATFAAGMKSKSPSIRARARLAKSIYDSNHQRLVIALEEIAKYVAPAKWSEMLNKKDSVHTPIYHEVLRVFLAKFGQVNGDDLPLLVLFKNLAANYPKADIIKAINNIF